MSERVILFGFIVLVGALTANAQSQRLSFSDPAAPPFFVRLQHTTSDREVCVLVRGDGLFHVERETSDRVEVSEGLLDDAELADLRRSLNEKELAALTQQKIAVPLVTTKRDELLISILRSPLTQNLTFPDRASRHPYEEYVAPLLHWLDALQRHTHTPIDEYSGRNNCLPPRQMKFSTRIPTNPRVEAEPLLQALESETSASPSAAETRRYPFLVRWNLGRIAGVTVQNTCVIIYSSGRFRMERSTQTHNDKLKLRVFEASLNAMELHELQEVIDEPQLTASTHQNSLGGKAFKEGELTTLTIPREGRMQQLSFASYSGSNVSAGTDPDERVVAPLRTWLKAHVEARKLGAINNTPATQCVPQSD
jgi:hypothetical protein